MGASGVPVIVPEARFHAIELLLDLADVAQVLVENRAVGCAERAAQLRRLRHHGVEQALLLLQPRGPLLRRAGLAEHALEGHARVDADRQRAEVVAPGEGVEERAGEPVACAHGRAHVLGADFDRTQRRVVGDGVGDVLIERLLRLDLAERVARSVACADRADAVEERRARAEVDRFAPRRLHLADGDELIAEPLERLHDRLELEVAADGRRMPRVRVHAVRHVDGPEPERRLCRRPRLGRQGRHHRIEHGQRHRGAKGAAQERAAGQMLLRDDHGCCTLAKER